MVKSRVVTPGYLVSWLQCNMMSLHQHTELKFRSVGSKCAKGLMTDFLASVAFLRHRNNYLRQKQIAPWRFVASSAEKKMFSSVFCQAWSFPSFLCIWRVPRRHTEGLWRHCVRDQNEGGRSTVRSPVPSRGYCNGEEPRNSSFYWSSWDLLRCFVLQSNKSIFLFSEPQSWSCVRLSVTHIWTTAYQSLLILIQNLTSPHGEGFKLSAFP